MEKNRKSAFITIIFIFAIMILIVTKNRTNYSKINKIVKPQAETAGLETPEKKDSTLQETPSLKWSEAKPEVKIVPPTIKEMQRVGANAEEASRRSIDPEAKKKFLGQRRVFE